MKKTNSKLTVLKTRAGLIITSFMVLGPVGMIRAYAGDAPDVSNLEEVDLSWISNGDSSVLDKAVETVADTTSAAYKLAITIGICVAVVAGVIAIIKLMSADRTKRNDAKDALFYILIGLVLLGALTSIISLALGIGAKVFN